MPPASISVLMPIIMITLLHALVVLSRVTTIPLFPPMCIILLWVPLQAMLLILLVWNP